MFCTYSFIEDHWGPVVVALLQHKHYVPGQHGQLAARLRGKRKAHYVGFSLEGPGEAQNASGGGRFGLWWSVHVTLPSYIGTFALVDHVVAVTECICVVAAQIYNVHDVGLHGMWILLMYASMGWDLN